MKAAIPTIHVAATIRTAFGDVKNNQAEKQIPEVVGFVSLSECHRFKDSRDYWQKDELAHKFMEGG